MHTLRDQPLTSRNNLKMRTCTLCKESPGWDSNLRPSFCKAGHLQESFILYCKSQIFDLTHSNLEGQDKADHSSIMQPGYAVHYKK